MKEIIFREIILSLERLRCYVICLASSLESLDTPTIALSAKKKDTMLISTNYTLVRVIQLIIVVLAALTSHVTAQTSQPKQEPDNWRTSEKRFAELMGITQTLKQLDDGTYYRQPGQLAFGMTPEGAATTKTVPEIQKVCGAPTSVNPQKDGSIMAFYGRLGYETRDGKTIKVIWVFFSERVDKKK